MPDPRPAPSREAAPRCGGALESGVVDIWIWYERFKLCLRRGSSPENAHGQRSRLCTRTSREGISAQVCPAERTPSAHDWARFRPLDMRGSRTRGILAWMESRDPHRTPGTRGCPVLGCRCLPRTRSRRLCLYHPERSPRGILRTSMLWCCPRDETIPPGSPRTNLRSVPPRTSHTQCSRGGGWKIPRGRPRTGWRRRRSGTCPRRTNRIRLQRSPRESCLRDPTRGARCA